MVRKPMLNEMAQDFHRNAKTKGFWSEGRDPLQVLMLVVSELVEAAEDIRSGLPKNEIYVSQPSGKPTGVPTELADAIIRILDACAAWEIDIDEAVRIKYAYNLLRPTLHGREF